MDFPHCLNNWEQVHHGVGGTTWRRVLTSNLAMSQPFQLHFNNEKKIVSITLLEEQGIFELANLFKELLDKAGIANTITEKPIEYAEQNS